MNTQTAVHVAKSEFCFEWREFVCEEVFGEIFTRLGIGNIELETGGLFPDMFDFVNNLLD